MLRSGDYLAPTASLKAGHEPILKHRFVTVRSNADGVSTGGRFYNSPAGLGRPHVPVAVSCQDAEPDGRFTAIATPGNYAEVELLSAGTAGQPCVADRDTGLAEPIANGDPGTRWFAGWLMEDGAAGDVVQIFFQPFGTEGIGAE